jgi:galactose mutarotase-like enzyme
MICNILNSRQDSILTVSTDGAQVLNWQIKDVLNNKMEDVFYQGSGVKRSGVPILFPFANPLKDNIFQKSGRVINQNGFGRNFPWRLKNLATNKPTNSLGLILTQEDISDEFKQAYPFKFQAEIDLELTEKKSLIYKLRIHNKSDEMLPIAPGLHPYFAIKHEFKTQLKILEIPEFQAENFAWNSELGGDFFNFKGQATCVFTDKTIVIKELSQKPEFENLVIWSQNSTKEDYNFVCLEPFTRKTNAINDNPILVGPEEIWEAQLEFEVR